MTTLECDIEWGEESSSREMRNRAEKQRRDKLNMHVNELAQLNPWTSSNEKKMDKTSVLLEENILRCGPTCPALTAEPASPPSLALTATTSPLGVPALSNGRQSVVVKPPRAVANGTHSPSDHEELRKNLQPDRCSGQPGPSDDGYQIQRRSFYIKLSQRATSRGEHAVYEMVHVMGTLRTTLAVSMCVTRMVGDVNVERSNQDTVLIAVGKLTTGYRRDLSIMDATKDEYVTRHTLEGLIIYCDHRRERGAQSPGHGANRGRQTDDRLPSRPLHHGRHQGRVRHQTHAGGTHHLLRSQ
ncbi:hypothetical protein B566_EDAN016848, partial [Ephemera danica]